MPVENPESDCLKIVQHIIAHLEIFQSLQIQGITKSVFCWLLGLSKDWCLGKSLQEGGHKAD